MAVLIEGVCAVVRRDAIEARVPGGWATFEAAVPSGAFCYDNELASVGFMAVEDAETFVTHLKALGLRVSLDSGDSDICVVEQLGRSGAPAPWLGTTRLSTDEIGGEVAVAFLSRWRIGHIAPNRSRNSRAARAAVRRRFWTFAVAT